VTEVADHCNLAIPCQDTLHKKAARSVETPSEDKKEVEMQVTLILK
jgi:hypothetical protein